MCTVLAGIWCISASPLHHYAAAGIASSCTWRQDWPLHHLEPMCWSYGTNVLVLWNQCACLMEPMCLFLWNQCACLMEPMCLFYGTNVLVLWNQCACLMESMCLSYGTNVLVLWNQCACLIESMCLSYGINVLVLWNQCACLMKSMCLAYGGGQMPHPYLAGQHC